MKSSVNEAFLNDWTGAREVELRSLGDTSFAVVTLDNGDVVTASLDGLIDEEAQRSHVEVLGERFRVSPQSFWQSHEGAPEFLTRAVLAAARARRGDRVVDLFSGVGLFSVPIARQVGSDGRVVAVEASVSACADARRNVADLPHVTVVEARVTPRVIRDVVDARSIVILDPPRGGAGVDVMSALVQAHPRRVVYVSCDAATLARDAKVLVDGGWDMTSLTAADLFPMTEHLELVATFEQSSR
jgi:tRNA/tmRNA/rRNA uracil-C5-methylase (TrmA/RlmC/RlmD family)